MKFLMEYLNSGNAKQQEKKKLGALLICATAILLCIALVVLTVASIVTAVKNRTAADDEGEGEGDGNVGYTTTTLDASQITQGNLVLVDADHPYVTMPEVVSVYDEPGRKTAEGDIIYSTTNQCYLTQEALTAVTKLLTAFNAKDGNDNVYVINTEYGTIVTLTYVDVETKVTNNSIYDAEAKAPLADYKWIYDNAAAYGFVRVSAAEGTENVFRYVGVAHAKAMAALSAETFDVYLEKLKTRCATPATGKTVNTDAGRYKIYYQAASADTPVMVPESNSYSVSGNGLDGFIITETISTKTK